MPEFLTPNTVTSCSPSASSSASAFQKCVPRDNRSVIPMAQKASQWSNEHTLNENVVTAIPGLSSTGLTQRLSRKESELAEVAMEHFVGVTPNSPLKRPSKASFLLECYKQAAEDASRYLHETSTATPRGSAVHQLSIVVRPEDKSLLMPTGVMPAEKRRAPRPLIGQKYTVLVPRVLLRASADPKSMGNPVIETLTYGHTVSLLRYLVLDCGKLRAQVLTSDNIVGWVTMIDDRGNDLLKLQLEEV